MEDSPIYQVENSEELEGFPPPNYTEIPNEFLDTLLRDMENISEVKVVLAAFRLTFGIPYSKEKLSMSFLEKQTGLDRNAVRQGLKAALRHGILYKTQEYTFQSEAIFAIAFLDKEVAVPSFEDLLKERIEKDRL